MNMKQDIASPFSGSYKAVNSCLVYTKAEGFSLLAYESTRNKPLKSDFPAFKLSFFLENSRARFMLTDTQQVTMPDFNAFLLFEITYPYQSPYYTRHIP